MRGVVSIAKDVAGISDKAEKTVHVIEREAAAQKEAGAAGGFEATARALGAVLERGIEQTQLRQQIAGFGGQQLTTILLIGAVLVVLVVVLRRR